MKAVKKKRSVRKVSGERISFDCTFNPEICARLRAKRFTLGLPYHIVGRLFNVSWSTIRKWELGLTHRCSIVHRPKLEGYLNGDFDEQLLGRKILEGAMYDVSLPVPVQVCMEKLATTCLLTSRNAHYQNRLLENVDEATREAVERFLLSEDKKGPTEE